MAITAFPIQTQTLLDRDNTWTGANSFSDVAINGPFVQGGDFAYLGAVNYQGAPDSGTSVAFSWNFSGGNGDVDIWNTFIVASPAPDAKAFDFRQLNGVGTSVDLVSIRQTGAVQANQFVVGSDFSSATNTVLTETVTPGSVSSAAQVLIDRTESSAAAELAQVNIRHRRVGGSGSREAIELLIDTSAANTSEYIIGVNSAAAALAGVGAIDLSVFGTITLAKCEAGTSRTNLVALETDTDARAANCDRKVGIQVVDEATSIGEGFYFDAGIIIGKQSGGSARGYNYGIQIGYNTGNALAELNTAIMYAPSGAIPYAFDFSGCTFSQAAWKGNFSASGVIKPMVTTVASLPSAATAGAGARAFVTDATVTTFASTVAGTGANKVPVYSDGANWKIG